MPSFWLAIVSWFPKEIWPVMIVAITATAGDAALTVVLAVLGRLGTAFDWRHLPRFLVTNFLPLALAAILGAVWVKFSPDYGAEYMAAMAGLTAYLHRGVRDKFKLLVGQSAGSETKKTAV